MLRNKFFAFSIFLAAPLFPTQAEQTQPESERNNTGNDDFHTDSMIVVTAAYGKELDVLAGTSVLSGDDLTKDLRGQIGDSLTSLPGVSSTSFAPGVSRPVLRGFQGPRVKVLTDGIGALDASNTSADHAVTIDPLTAQRIEILRGPAVLLYGGDAIGGAVNVIDKRIPRDVPEHAFHLDTVAGYGSAANDRSIAGSLDVPLTSHLVAHVDGSFRKTKDVRVPGFVLAPSLRAKVIAAAVAATNEGNLGEAAEFTATANIRRRVPNTASETKTVGGGLAYIGDGGNLGFSVSYYDSDYGVPARPGTGQDGEEEGEVTIGLEQIRVDLRGGVDLPGFFEKLSFRAGYSSYEHTEFEGVEIGTVFSVEGVEARAELVQAEHQLGDHSWRGVIGTQILAREFDAVGAEAFVPKNTIESWALFTVQEVDFGDFEIEVAARHDHTSISSALANFNRNFNAFSGAISLAYAPDGEPLKIGMNISRAERAPSAEELLSNGPHIATQAFEIGNPGFTTEKSWGSELYARWDSDDIQLSATIFANFFDDYIFETETGALQDGLPVFQFFQRKATYYGFEASASVKFAEAGNFDLIVDAVADAVRAKIKNGGGPIPRIPPLRLLGGVEAQSEVLDLRAEVEWSSSQRRVTNFETPTSGFTMVNASVSWRPFGKDGNLTLLASANNIFDATARRHASFTKDYVPLAGRDIRFSAKVSF